MYKIAITTSSFGVQDSSYLDLIRSKGIEIILNPFARQLTPAEAQDLYQDIDGVIAGTEKIDMNLLKIAKKLKVISRCGTGMDNVDIEAAKSFHIQVFNTPDAPTLAVAEMTVGLILDLLRRISLSDRMIRLGKWQKLQGRLLHEKQVGIIGFGRIGQKVAQLLQGFGCSISFYDTRSDISKPLSFKQISLIDLLKTSDIVLIHSSGRTQIIGQKELDLMKPDALLINIARGGTIDERALFDVLRAGKLFGAALDVFEQEPYQGPLKTLDQVILTPHIGSAAIESRIQMEKESVFNLLKGFGLA